MRFGFSYVTASLSRRLTLMTVAIIFVTVALFVGYGYWSQKSAGLAAVDGKLRAVAAAVKMETDAFHDRMQNPAAIDKGAYERMVKDLSRFAEEAGVKYVYTVMEKEGKLFFSTSSYTREEMEKGEHMKMFDPYEDPSQGLKAAIADGKVHFDEYTDQWGSFRSVFIPATSPGGVRYVTCVDLEISNIAAMLRKQLLYTSLLGCLVFMIAIVATMLMIHPMSRTIVTLTEGVSRITRGDLSVNLECTRTDELGRLARDMNGMVANLRSIVGSVQESAGEIVHAAGDQYRRALQMATDAEDVAGQASTVATAGEEIAGTSGEITQNCINTSEASSIANKMASSGEDVVAETITRMHRIAERVNETAQTISGLGKRSDQIGVIAATIEDIADQTNLIALNAAIEAARAGEVGRGFAVVADEVRALAERTAKATREITTMIRTIQQETAGAIASMQEGVTEVNAGTDGAARSRKALQEILEQINAVSFQVNQIATASGEQTITTSEISKSIHQITHVVQETAQSAHKSADAADRMQLLAGRLQELMGQFRTAETETASASGSP